MMSNGSKIDRNHLRTGAVAHIKQQMTKKNRQNAQDETEKIVLAAFAEILGVKVSQVEVCC